MKTLHRAWISDESMSDQMKMILKNLFLRNEGKTSSQTRWSEKSFSIKKLSLEKKIISKNFCECIRCRRWFHPVTCSAPLQSNQIQFRSTFSIAMRNRRKKVFHTFSQRNFILSHNTKMFWLWLGTQTRKEQNVRVSKIQTLIKTSFRINFYRLIEFLLSHAISAICPKFCSHFTRAQGFSEVHLILSSIYRLS